VWVVTVLIFVIPANAGIQGGFELDCPDKPGNDVGVVFEAFIFVIARRVATRQSIFDAVTGLLPPAFAGVAMTMWGRLRRWFCGPGFYAAG
jgi:hypothetical protein